MSAPPQPAEFTRIADRDAVRILVCVDRYLPAWGKIDTNTAGSFHCLEHHCADVAACFEILVADRILARRFARAAERKTERLDPVTLSRLAVVAFLHDFGKLNTGFQFKVRDRDEIPPAPPPKSGHITEAFYCVAQQDICDRLQFAEMLEQWGDGVDALLLGALSHHGRPPRQANLGGGPRSIWEPFAGYDPLAAAEILGQRARDWFPDAFASGPCLPATPALAHLFAGTVALADQIGSDRDNHFPFEPNPDPGYIYRARERAARAIHARGLKRSEWISGVVLPDFREMFGHAAPRPLQAAVQEAPLDQPLVILESETGSGKTEAALLRFAALWKAGLVDGLYFALPTRAAAKQLHRRVYDAMKPLLPPGVAERTVLAVPGYCVAGEATGRPAGGFEVIWEDQPDEAERVARWSAESTRHFLGSPVAVGTVDQALLGALKVKWAHLRGASMARSLLVVDEVHASDTYMTELLATLLDGHIAVGGHALLMSATLGSSARVLLAGREPGGETLDPVAAAQVPYPCLTFAGNGSVRTESITATGVTKKVAMEVRPWLGDADGIAGAALTAARHGAKVLVILNTVVAAQAVLEALTRQGGERLALAVNGVPTVHHSRFAVEDRNLLDVTVEAALGKGRAVAGGLVVIGTQTLEQSLDIDADLLISDICPVDVLLQRIGRLHRHSRKRPEGYDQPRCLVLVPPDGLESGLDGALTRHGLGMRSGATGGGIYRDLLALEQTRRLAVAHDVWCIPEMNRMLVERATNPNALQELRDMLGGAWLSHEQQGFGIRAAERQVARNHRLDRSEPFDEKLAFPDSDENVRTRLGEDGPRFELVEGQVGPFGTPVRTFNLPAHLFGGVESMPSRDELGLARLDCGDDGATLHVGSHAFRYNHAGISRGGRG